MYATYEVTPHQLEYLYIDDNDDVDDNSNSDIGNNNNNNATAQWYVELATWPKKPETLNNGWKHTKDTNQVSSTI